MFTASSHHPFKIPEKYQGKFQKGTRDIHEPIQYTDLALKRYFETAKKQPWYNNTIFVITGDHVNQSYYKEYQAAMNLFAVPILFYSPNPKYNLKGIDHRFVQQMDIYPTLADFLGYKKPMRSWGKSLLTEDSTPHIIVNSDGANVRFIHGDHIYVFDGDEITGVFSKADLSLSQNLLHKTGSPEIEKGKNLSKAWYQDYMARIIQKKL